MAKATGRKLKVFQAQFGFYDSVVAVSSQAAALKAWDVRQNLFANGDAKLVQDEAAVKAALAHPDTPLFRAIGSTDPFLLEPTGLPRLPKEVFKSKGNGARKASDETKATSRPPADRSKLDAAEAKLRKLENERKRELSAFDEKQAALDEAVTSAQARYVENRKAAAEHVADAKKRYEQASGRD